MNDSFFKLLNLYFLQEGTDDICYEYPKKRERKREKKREKSKVMKKKANILKIQDNKNLENKENFRWKKYAIGTGIGLVVVLSLYSYAKNVKKSLYDEIIRKINLD